MDNADGATERFFRLGEVVIDRDTRTVFRDGTTTRLEPRVFEVLDYLAGQGGREVPRSELVAKVWHGTHVVDEAIHRAISHLRSALGDSAKAPTFLLTTSQPGYRLLHAVASVSAPSAAAKTAAADRPSRLLAFGGGAVLGVAGVLLIQALQPEPRYAPPAPPADPAAPTNLVAPEASR